MLYFSTPWCRILSWNPCCEKRERMIGHILYWLCIFPIAEAIEIIYTILYRVVDDYGIATVGLSFAVTLLTLAI